MATATDYTEQVARLKLPGTTDATINKTPTPSLEDFVSEAQKLGTQSLEAQKGILRQDIGEVGESLSKSLYGRNVGEQGGLQSQIVQGAIGEQAKRLEPVAEKIAAGLGEQTLTQQFQATETEKGRSFQKLNRLADAVSSGQLRGTPADAVMLEMGIDDPAAFLSADQQDLERYANAKGLTVDEVIAQRRRVGEVLDADMASHPERYAALAIDPVKEKERELELSRARNPQPIDTDEGTYLCSVLFKNGDLPETIYKADCEMGKRIGLTAIRGYHFWAIPLGNLMKRNKIIYSIMRPIVKSWATQMHYEINEINKINFLGKLLEIIGVPICRKLGKYLKKRRKEIRQHVSMSYKQRFV